MVLFSTRCEGEFFCIEEGDDEVISWQGEAQLLRSRDRQHPAARRRVRGAVTAVAGVSAVASCSWSDEQGATAMR
ncbi:MAG: hypothetical protein ACI9BK_003296 [Acidimicrobiales bacterium]|jgi:hypothetical protein